jgi:hypothetical protein
MTAFNFLFRDTRDNWQSRVLYAISIAGLSWIALGALFGGV